MTSFFGGLGDDDERELRSKMVRRRFDRNEVVFHQGDPGASVHVVESGWFLVQAHTSSGEKVGMTIEGPGDMFGELAILDSGGVRTATVRALRTGETMSLDREQFHRLRESETWVDRFLVSLLARRVERLSGQLAETAWLPADKRVCRLLNRLVDVFEPGPILLKQAELASLAQTTRPTVSSVLSDLAREGIVKTGRGSVEVLDRHGLGRRL